MITFYRLHSVRHFINSPNKNRQLILADTVVTSDSSFLLKGCSDISGDSCFFSLYNATSLLLQQGALIEAFRSTFDCVFIARYLLANAISTLPVVSIYFQCYIYCW